MFNPFKIFKDKLQAYRVARQAGAYRDFAEMKNNGATNTRVSAKEQASKKKRKQIAKASRRRNRK